MTSDERDDPHAEVSTIPRDIAPPPKEWPGIGGGIRPPRYRAGDELTCRLQFCDHGFRLKRKRVLIVNGGFPLPANSGVNMRSWNFVRALRDTCDVSLIYPNRRVRQIAPELIDQAERSLTQMWPVAVDPSAASRHDTLTRRLGRKLRFIPWEIHASYRAAFATRLREVVSEHQFDIILARHIYQAQYLFDLPEQIEARVIVDLDDIETRRAPRQLDLRATGRDGRWRSSLNNWILGEYHRRRLSRIDTCLVCSDEDRRYVIERRWTTRVQVIANAIDVSSAAPATAGEARTLLFCGTLSYEPNADAIVWFAREVLPHIKRVHSDVRVLVVGHAPPAQVRALSADPSIEIHPDVADVSAFYRRASAIVVPIRVAGGTRMKILEAGSLRKPVVSTTIGAEGLGLVPDRHFLMADTAADFAAQCAKLLENAALSAGLATELHRLVESKFDTSVVFGDIRRVFEVAN
jgi:glycosyltransferase involved in cell wall biosynthesis